MLTWDNARVETFNDNLAKAKISMVGSTRGMAWAYLGASESQHGPLPSSRPARQHRRIQIAAIIAPVALRVCAAGMRRQNQYRIPEHRGQGFMKLLKSMFAQDVFGACESRDYVEKKINKYSLEDSDDKVLESINQPAHLSVARLSCFIYAR